MKKETYICDHCGTQDSSKEAYKSLVSVAITVEDRAYGRTLEALRFEICRPCANKLGVAKLVVKEDKLELEKTTAEKLYEAVVSLVEEHIGEVLNART
jgi:hypothetical protein